MRYGERTFVGQDVELDGNRFERCVLRNCRLLYRGGPLPELIDNTLVECDFKLEGAAKQTILFCRMLGTMKLDQIVEMIVGEIRKPFL